MSKTFPMLINSVLSRSACVCAIALLLSWFSATTVAQQPAAAPAKTPVVTQTLIDESIAEDARLKATIAPYSARVRALDDVIGQVDTDLTKAGIGAGSLGNFVADGLRAQAMKKLGDRTVALLITNSGGLRRTAISRGDLRAKDIFELLPFENALIKMDLSGAQLLRLLNIVLTGRDAQSGARVSYRLDAQGKQLFEGAKLLTADGSEVDIDPQASYTIVTVDYLYNLASGDYAILQEGKNVQPLGLTMRETMIDYVKALTAAGRRIAIAGNDRYVEKKSEGMQ
jgi:2',3'-cyclic-nucleotide 2'-phosphodiesterase / 3'-nucleotidase / 5'-nucleotidase